MIPIKHGHWFIYCPMCGSKLQASRNDGGKGLECSAEHPCDVTWLLESDDFSWGSFTITVSGECWGVA